MLKAAPDSRRARSRLLRRLTREELDARGAFAAFQASINYPATVPGFRQAWREMTAGGEPTEQATRFFRDTVTSMLHAAAIDDWDVDADAAEKWQMDTRQACTTRP